MPIQPIQVTLFDMITSGSLKAKIDEKQRMITFLDETKASDHQQSHYLEVVEELETQNKRIVQLMQKLQGVDSSIKLNKKFIKKELTSTNLQTSGSGGGNSMM